MKKFSICPWVPFNTTGIWLKSLTDAVTIPPIGLLSQILQRVQLRASNACLCTIGALSDIFKAVFQSSSTKSECTAMLRIDSADSSGSSLNLEWAVRPPNSRSDAVPLQASIRTILPSVRSLPAMAECRSLFPLPPGPLKKTSGLLTDRKLLRRHFHTPFSGLLWDRQLLQRLGKESQHLSSLPRPAEYSDCLICKQTTFVSPVTVAAPQNLATPYRFFIVIHQSRIICSKALQHHHSHRFWKAFSSISDLNSSHYRSVWEGCEINTMDLKRDRSWRGEAEGAVSQNFSFHTASSRRKPREMHATRNNSYSWPSYVSRSLLLMGPLTLVSNMPKKCRFSPDGETV